MTLTIPDFDDSGSFWTSPAGRRMLNLAAEIRVARRERITEIYRTVWNPVPEPGEGWPHTPDDHIWQTLQSLRHGDWADTHPTLGVLAEHAGVDVAAEYASLLVAEALSPEWRRRAERRVEGAEEA